MREPMTRAEAVCACRNIRDLCEDLVRAPESYRESLSSKAADMEAGIISRDQYDRVTENMDRALRNMWSGLRKWDREGAYNDNLFDDLAAVEADLEDLRASQSVRGRERDENILSPEMRARVAEINAGAPPANAREALLAGAQESQSAGETPTGPLGAFNALSPVAVRALCAEVERDIDSDIHGKGLSILAPKALKYADMATLLSMTKSDRTQQLMKAAHLLGQKEGARRVQQKVK